MSRAVTLITGASSGIGLALAEVFAAHGHDLLLVSRSADRLQRAAHDIAAAAGVFCDYLAADLVSKQGTAKVLTALARRAYEIDVLVNNAGVLHEGGFLDMALEPQLQLVELNLTAVLRLTHPLAQAMRARGAGRILNVASTSAFNPVPSLACYAASKAFLLSFGEALSIELRGSGVTSTVLCPGFTDTAMIAQDGRKPMKLPLVPNLSPREVAECGYRACMRGQTVAVPGLLNRAGSAAMRRLPGGLRRELIALIERHGI